MKKLIIIISVVFLLSVNTAYSQQNFLHINMDLSSKIVSVDSSYELESDFNVDDMIKRIDNEYLFTFSYNSEADFEDFKLKIILPEESVVSEKQDTLLVSKPVQISTDGRRIYLEWSTSLEKDEEFTTFAQYKAKESETIYYSIFVIIIILAAFLIGYNTKKFKKDRFVKAVLSEDEKKVVKIIKSGGETTQDELKKRLEWSKTKTSKIIRNLEAKNIIIKKPYKKTNKIKLK